MFTKKAPSVRITDPKILRTKAIEFLTKNYNKYKYNPESQTSQSKYFPQTFYTLSEKSNNFMVKNTRIEPKESDIKIVDKDNEYVFFKQSYTDTNGKNIVTGIIQKLFKRNKTYVFFDNQPIWFKTMPFGKNASDVIFYAGKRKTKQKVSKRKTRRR